EEGGRRSFRRVDVAAGTDEFLTWADYPNRSQTFEWSRRDNWIVYDQLDNGSPLGSPRRILAVKAVGTGNHTVAQDGYDNYAPSISPNAEMVAYLSRRDGTTHIVTANLNGSNKRSIRTTHSFSRLAWSPSGDQIAFAMTDSAVWKIYVMNPDGTGLKALGPGQRPKWAPIGRRILAATPGTSRDVHIYDLNAGTRETVISGAAISGVPRWSPDGGRILLATNNGMQINIFHLDRREWEEVGPMHAWSD